MIKPTITLFPGATLTAEHFRDLLAEFESRGYPTACANPPSITAENATTVTAQDEIDFAQGKVLVPLLVERKDVVVVVHSYAGGYGAAAVKGLSKDERAERGEDGGVIGLIYLASTCVDPGETPLGILSESGPKPGLVPGETPATIMFIDYKPLWPSLLEEEGTRWLKKLKPCAVSACLGVIPYAPYQDAYYKDSLAFVTLEDDVIVREDMDKKSLAKSGITLTRNIKGAHGTNFEARDEVGRVIVELMGLFVK